MTPSVGLSGASQAVRPELRGSLLYSSGDYTCGVSVFTYPRGKLVQTLNVCDLGFGPAFGLCTDKRGDVFMAMGEGSTVFEFAHGGTKPIAQLQAGSLLPVGCSVDPETGDLGVGSVGGDVAVFKNATGTPQTYSLSDVPEFFFCTYDDRDNLFAGGEHNDNSFALAELPKGGSALREITVPGGFSPEFALQWDGHHVALGKAQGSSAFTVARIRVTGSVAKVVAKTSLDAAPNTLTPFQFWIRGGTIIQPEMQNSEIGFWNYPAGGRQTKGLKIGATSLVGITVSAAPR
jgi:hypothetical protein